MKRSDGFRTTPMRFRPGQPEECIVHRQSKIEGSQQLILDLIPISPILEDVWNRRVVFQWKDRTIKVVSVEGLAVMKRLAGRDRDLLDLKELGLIGAEDEEEPDGSQDEGS